MLNNSSQDVIAGSRPLFGGGAPWRIRLGAIQWLILSAAALVIAIALGTGYFALQYRERALEVAERELNNTRAAAVAAFRPAAAAISSMCTTTSWHYAGGRGRYRR